MRSDTYVLTDSFSDYQSHAACCCRLFETHKGECTISQTRPEPDTNVLDVLTASENMPRGSQHNLRLSFSEECSSVLLAASILFAFTCSNCSRFLRFVISYCIYLSISPPTTSTNPALALTVYNSSSTEKTSFVSRIPSR